jgi:putative endopeptidase
VVNLQALKAFNVTEPKFFAELERQLASRPVAEIRTYLRWHYVRAQSRLLSKAFVDRNFDFYSKTSARRAEQKPRWKRCVALVGRPAGRGARPGVRAPRRSIPRSRRRSCA